MIEVRCQGSTVVSIDEVTEFQGDLKSLSNKNYDKLKAEILRHGICEPITIWQKNGKKLIANGHQRIRVLRKMQEEGFIIPNIPVNKVNPKNEKEFAEIVLSLTSQYGEIEKEGLYEYMNKHQINLDYVKTMKFPEINMKKFELEFFKDATPSKVVGVIVECPKCQHEFPLKGSSKPRNSGD